MTIIKDSVPGKQPLNNLPNRIRLHVPSFRRILLAAEEKENIEYDENELLITLFDLLKEDALGQQNVEYYALQLALDQTNHILDDISFTLDLFVRLGKTLHDALRNLGLYHEGKLEYIFQEIRNGTIILQERSTYYKDLANELNGNA